ncbi:CDP-paratose 2-epimerase [Sulfodiicoccus acidiphilus]|uniref:CDP-paratose 2-epimerase n=1 Tax=Sulfodiicoccus acidiphilus TaxID=1670455 RepID=A0A348B5Q0_9CREN|nr:NAD-dependent epimerase/dehydratase family protein [Sulfodiicoccus acidiphilus]BBD73502.1 CDP-paratose 2-epimerase [Sulfodiicoccus acidiphilus]GGT92702.1 CDP-paratose 2-epimerase [Sulfodiicoccus acidiphilus]
MKAVVTGGAGFIGSRVAESLARDGFEVVVFDNFGRGSLLGKSLGDPLYNWRRIEHLPSVRLFKGDVRDRSAVLEATKGADVIVHTAAQVAVTTSLTDPVTDFEVNARGTLNVLEAARLNDSSFVLSSTNKVYGERVNAIPVREEPTRYEFADSRFRNGVPEDFGVDLTGHTPYGTSKLLADLYAQDYHHTYGLKTGVFRMSCVYGDHQFGVEDQGWVAWFTIATLTDRPITIYGDGKQVRDVLFVDDMVRAYRLFLSSGLKHGVYNLGGGPENTLSLLELLSLLRELTGKSPRVGFSDWRRADQKVYVSDVSKAERELGWRPEIGVREGVSRLVKWAQDYLASVKV